MATGSQAETGGTSVRVGPHHPTPPSHAPRSAVLGLVVIAVLLVWRISARSWSTALLLGVSAAVLVVSTVAAPARTERVLAGVGALAGTVIARVGFAVAAVPLVLLPRMIDVLAAVDPLAGSGWTRAPRRRGVAQRAWSPASTGVDRWGRVRRTGVVLAGGAVLLLGLGVWSGGGAGPPGGLASAPWYEQYRSDLESILDSEQYHPLSDVRILNARSRYVNVEQGRRLTWRAPECECRRLRVWLYGGSTTFGLGQRDEHTIASELARAAWAEGVVVDVENRGMLGDTHWAEARRLSWDLAEPDAPDLVLFLDGANEWLAAQASDDLLAPVPQVRSGSWVDELTRHPLPVIDVQPAGSIEQTSGATRALLLERYASASQLSAMAAARAGVPTVSFWEPVAQAPPLALPDGVVDLSGVLGPDAAERFHDGSHLDEQGAQLVAQSMLSSIRGELDRLAAQADPATPGSGR